MSVWIVRTTGEAFAVEVDGDGAVTGVCGPLSRRDTDNPESRWSFDTDPDTLATWQARWDTADGVTGVEEARGR